MGRGVVASFVVAFACALACGGAAFAPDAATAGDDSGDGEGGNGTTDATASSSSDDAPDSGSDAGVVTCPYSGTNDEGSPYECGSRYCPTPVCCFTASRRSGCVQGASCDDSLSAENPKAIVCTTSLHCPYQGKPNCCLRTKAPIDTSVCASVVTYDTLEESHCLSGCPPDEYETCVKDADCRGRGTCRRVRISEIALELGLCM